jgi:formylglycine-generating enzyme required for sulfatase activity
VADDPGNLEQLVVHPVNKGILMEIRPGYAISTFKYLGVVLLLQVSALTAQAQNKSAEFYRITADADVVITEFAADGSLSWSNSTLGGTSTVECADALAETVEWLPLTSIPTTSTVMQAWVWDTHPMMAIPAGELLMGNSVTSDESYNELPTHPVGISAFSMDKYEVPLDLWNIVASWARKHGYDIADTAAAKGGNHPVVNVSWYDCVKWCNARSERQGLTPCYRSPADTNNVYRFKEMTVIDEYGTTVEFEFTADCVLWNANGYRLPTEAEWEYAARGGIVGERFPGPSSNVISHETANYLSNFGDYIYNVNPTTGYHPAYTNGAEPYTSPVGSFPVNGYGLSDMAGNASEWCWDWFDGDWYTNTAASLPDTPGPTTVGSRVTRGGSWNYVAYAARCSGRDTYDSRGNNSSIGFRTVRRDNANAIQFIQTQSTQASLTKGAGLGNISKASASGNSKAAKVARKTEHSTVRSDRH